MAFFVTDYKHYIAYMWQAEMTTIDSNTTKYSIADNGKTMSYADVISALKSDSDFTIYFNNLLAASKYQAYFWEVKPVSQLTLQQPFEFVLANSNSLAHIKADSSAFDKYLSKQQHVASFPNLGGDSMLIAPTSIGATDYGHIAQFVRSAPAEQVAAFWKQVGEELNKSIGSSPKWLSTSGLAVYWLHVRIDPTSKYYNYLPYKKG